VLWCGFTAQALELPTVQAVPPHLSPAPGDRIEVGRLGEEVVWKLLVERYGADRVEWVNRQHESGLPYDLRVAPAVGGGGDNESGSSDSAAAEVFIEVKTTREDVERLWERTWSDVVPISYREFELAQQHGRAYQVIAISSSRLRALYEQTASSRISHSYPGLRILSMRLLSSVNTTNAISKATRGNGIYLVFFTFNTNSK
jgi:hypothetical protein